MGSVDNDIIFGGSSHALVSSFAEQMSREFEMSLVGELQFFLGLQIKQGPEGTFVHTRDILKKFNMGDSKPMTTPMSTNTTLDADEDGEAVDQKEFRGMIGSLLYLTATRPDIQFAVCLCAHYQASPRTSHRQAMKHIFNSLLSLVFGTPWVLLFLLEGSQMLTMLAAELIASQPPCILVYHRSKVYSCCYQLLWMKATLSDFGLRFGRILLLVYSTSAIPVAKNPVLHSRTKHIDVRFHFLRDHYEKGDIDLVHVVTQNQLADIFTKPLELQVEGVDNALIKGEIESQWTGLIALLV
ncbi:hypothetical protein U9M48_023754 [Paspalum notatum var. saurae]|uniref:Reverse transcriptase Ty1/copia-type domain-containing protein n=1 Tax=Paspalum notatum var. saurae TaxID=547442 RepID=A0AAQ3TKC7_PASNO